MAKVAVIPVVSFNLLQDGGQRMLIARCWARLVADGSSRQGQVVPDAREEGAGPRPRKSFLDMRGVLLLGVDGVWNQYLYGKWSRISRKLLSGTVASVMKWAALGVRWVHCKEDGAD